jgi:hypothetical protein
VFHSSEHFYGPPRRRFRPQVLKKHERAQHGPISVCELVAGSVDPRNGGSVAAFNAPNRIFEEIILPVKVVSRALVLNRRSRNCSLPVQI